MTNKTSGRGASRLVSGIKSSFSDDMDINAEDFTYQSLETTDNIRIIPLERLEKAPEEWNFYSKLPDDKFYSMKESILQFGILHPILVWEKPGGKEYIILSGHNRFFAVMELYEETQESRFRGITARVIRSKSIDEISARQIVSIGNYAQRTLTAQEEYEGLKSIYLYNIEKLNVKTKMENYQSIQEKTGKDLSTIKRILNLGKLIPELYKMVGKTIPFKKIQGLAVRSEEDQRWVYDNYKDKLNSKTVGQIKKFMERETIRRIFEEDDEPYEYVQLTIPKVMEPEVKFLIKEWEKANDRKWEYK